MVQARKQQGWKVSGDLTPDAFLKQLRTDGLEFMIDAMRGLDVDSYMSVASERLQGAVPKACQQLPSEAEAQAARAAFDAAVTAA
jgi:predicted lipoprotein